MFWKKKKKNDNVSYTEIKVEVPIKLSPETYIRAINVLEKEQEITVNIGDKIYYYVEPEEKEGVVIGSYFTIGWREPQIIAWNLLVSEIKDDKTSGVVERISFQDIRLTKQEKRIRESNKDDILRDIKSYCSASCLYDCDADCPLKKYKI